MARKDRLLPPVSQQITDYSAEHMETYHKKIYKSFLRMRQHIGTAYKNTATRAIIDGKICYTKYNLLNNISKGTAGYETLKWHGMTEEAIQKIIDYNNSNNLERLNIIWSQRRLYDQAFFDDLEVQLQSIILRTYGQNLIELKEENLIPSLALTNIESGVWNIYFGFNLFDIIIDANNNTKIAVNIARKQNIINIAETGESMPAIPILNGVVGNYDRIRAGLVVIQQLDSQLFISGVSSYNFILVGSNAISKEKFEIVSQDDFFDKYAENISIDSKVDTKWYEDFFSGLLKGLGTLLNFMLDVLLNLPLIGNLVEWVIEGIAGLFNMTFEEAREAFIKAIVFIIALYLSIPTGGASLYTYVEWVSTAYSLGGIAGDLATMTYESPIGTIKENEDEELKREIEKIGLELTVLAMIHEPDIRLNRPEEELRVDGGNNSTYNIFRLD